MAFFRNIKKEMMSKLFQDTNNEKKESNEDKITDKNTKKITLLVIKSSNDGSNFYKLFGKDCKLKDGTKVIIEQGGWSEIQLTAYSDSLSPIVDLKASTNPLPDTPQNKHRCIQPDFLLIRELCRGVKPEQDHRNTLYGFMVAQTPSINSLHSMYCMNERALMNAELIRLNRKHGQKNFPIFEQNFYPSHDSMVITPSYPLVVKIGHAQAGFGKIMLSNHSQFGDVKSIVAMTSKYCTAERFIEGSHDLRLQKIGNNSYKAYKRTSMSGNWKTNTGTSMIEEIEMTQRYKFWMDECSKAFGCGFDICTVDVLVSAVDGKELILEFNGTASGFCDQEKDNEILRSYVMEKLNGYFVDGIKELNEIKYANNDDLVKDVKDAEKYDDGSKYCQDKKEEKKEDGLNAEAEE